MKLQNRLVLFVLVLLLSACSAGVDFVKPADNQLVLGSTTKSQIIALMGEPNFKGQKELNGENIESIGYAYAKVGGEAVFDGVTPARSVGYLFHNNALVGKEFSSSFKSDNTYFDPHKAKSVKKGMTMHEVVTLLGKAGGEYRYPVISNKYGKALVYIFVQTKGFKSEKNVLVVELDKNGVVQKSEFTQVGQL